MTAFRRIIGFLRTIFELSLVKAIQYFNFLDLFVVSTNNSDSNFTLYWLNLHWLNQNVVYLLFLICKFLLHRFVLFPPFYVLRFRLKLFRAIPWLFLIPFLVHWLLEYFFLLLREFILDETNKILNHNPKCIMKVPKVSGNFLCFSSATILTSF